MKNTQHPSNMWSKKDMEANSWSLSILQVDRKVKIWTHVHFPYTMFVQPSSTDRSPKVRVVSEQNRTVGVRVKYVSPRYKAGWTPQNAEGMEAIPSMDSQVLEIPDPVNHPSHYGGKDNPYETIKVMEARLTTQEFIGAMKFNVYKYNDRAKQKGSEAENYKKAQFYQNYLVDFMRRHDVDSAQD